MARAIPPSVCRSSGSSVRLPAKPTLGSVMLLPSLPEPDQRNLLQALESLRTVLTRHPEL